MMRSRISWISVVATLALAGCSAKAENEPPPKAYTLTVAVAPTAPKPAESAAWTLTITPKAPWVLKTTTPLTAVLKSSAGVKVDKSPLKADDIVDPKAEAKAVRTGFVANQSGPQSITAELTFFLCTDEICQRQKDTVAVNFTVP